MNAIHGSSGHSLRLLAMLALAALISFGNRPAAAEDMEGADAATQRIRHLLRRATFGVRTGDVEAVKKLGLESWIDRQLKPELIADPEVSKRLSKFKTLRMTGGEYLRMVQGGAMNAGSMGPPKPGEDRVAKARKRQRELNRLRYLGSREIPQALVLRAVYSERQLHEVMKEFWRNHFNVDITKDDVRYYITDWDREVLGKNTFGSFESLLMATAKHPAMLFYLDNHVSQAPKARGERVLSGREKEDRTGGLNENYARELMELHTLGADNGYKQRDVIQLSLVLTGWSINRTAGPDGGTFLFRESYHAKGKKQVVGKMVGNEGVKEGETLIRHLAHHKNTAPFVVTKMARYLAADEPSQNLVDDVVAVWKKTKGNLGAVTKAICSTMNSTLRRTCSPRPRLPLSSLRVAYGWWVPMSSMPMPSCLDWPTWTNRSIAARTPPGTAMRPRIGWIPVCSPSVGSLRSTFSWVDFPAWTQAAAAFATMCGNSPPSGSQC